MKLRYYHCPKNALGFTQHHGYGAGFTLLELLVVIAIIGIVSTATVVNLNQAKAKARDARRLSDITQLRKAIEIYYYTEGEYPNAVANPSDPTYKVCSGLTAVLACNSTAPNPNTDWIPDLISQTGELPVDPLNNETYFYVYTRWFGDLNTWKDYYYILYKLETQTQENECGSLMDVMLPDWSCKGGGTLPQP